MTESYLHVSIHYSDKGYGDEVWSYNLSDDQVSNLIVLPFTTNRRIICNGVVINPEHVDTLRVYETDFRIDTDNEDPKIIIHESAFDVTNEILNTVSTPIKQNANPISYDLGQAFVVHGHDTTSKLELARMLENELGIKAIILHEQANGGKTIIEKLERHSDRPGYAFVLLTPDDVGGIKSPDDDASELKTRARQNVIFELGYFVGKLGRERVCCLYNGEVEIPSDMAGVLYLPFQKSVKECFSDIVKELKHAGYQLKI